MNMLEPALMRTQDGQAVALVEVTGTARADGPLLQTTFRQRYANAPNTTSKPSTRSRCRTARCCSA